MTLLDFKREKRIFDAISNTLKQSRTSVKSEEVKDKESGNVGLDSKNSSNLNLDFISQAIAALREKRSIGAINKQQCSTKKQLFFDKISNMLKSLKGENNDECRTNVQKK